MEEKRITAEEILAEVDIDGQWDRWTMGPEYQDKINNYYLRRDPLTSPLLPLTMCNPSYILFIGHKVLSD